MADTVASLVAVITADVSGAVNGMNKVGTGLSGISDKLLKTGALITAGVTVPIIGFLGATVKAASDLEDQMAQTNAVIKSTGGVAKVTADAVLKLATSMSDTTRFSKDQVISAENLLLTFRDIGSKIFPDVTQATLDMSQALGQDTKSSAIQLGKALEEPIKGVTALRRVGVAFTDAQLNMIKVMVKSGDLLGAQKIILKEVQTEFGGSAKAAGQTFAGQMDILNHKFTDFQEKVGVLIIPILTKLLDVGMQVVNWLNTLNPNVLQAGIVILGLVAAIGPVVTIVGALGAAIAFIASPIGIIIALVAALALAWSTDFLGIRETTYKIIKDVTAFIHDFINTVREAIAAINQLQKTLSGQSSGNFTLHQATAGESGIGMIAGHAAGGWTGGGATNAVAGVVHGQEFVVPHNGALVSGGGYKGPSTIHVVLKAENFEDHLFVKLATAERMASS